MSRGGGGEGGGIAINSSSYLVAAHWIGIFFLPPFRAQDGYREGWGGGGGEDGVGGWGVSSRKGKT